jgi:hypothetical protein
VEAWAVAATFGKQRKKEKNTRQERCEKERERDEARKQRSSGEIEKQRVALNSRLVLRINLIFGFRYTISKGKVILFPIRTLRRYDLTVFSSLSLVRSAIILLQAARESCLLKIPFVTALSVLFLYMNSTAFEGKMSLKRLDHGIHKVSFTHLQRRQFRHHHHSSFLLRFQFCYIFLSLDSSRRCDAITADFGYDLWPLKPIPCCSLILEAREREKKELLRQN